MALRRSIGVLALFAVAAIAAPWLTPYSPTESLDLITAKLRPPSWAHPFGTDRYSRDVLSRVLHGARVSLAVASLAVLLSLLIGTTIGAAAGVLGGRVERAIRGGIDVLFSVPPLLVLLAVAALWEGLSTASLVLLIGGLSWFDVARLVADETGSLMTRDFVLAAQATGVRRLRLLRHHLFPHLVPLLAVNGTLGIARTISLEAGLSFLGLGIRPPAASWGTILGDGASMIQTAWWLTVFPGVAIVLAVLAFNALGDALRDRFAARHVAGAADTSPLVEPPRLLPAPLS